MKISKLTKGLLIFISFCFLYALSLIVISSFIDQTATVTPIPLGNSQPIGTINSQVTQDNLSTTVCVSGWTATIRPPASYTTALKKKQLLALNAKDQNLAHYEEDHFISLEIGGNPTDPNNLWPQPYPEAKQKDAVENYLHNQLCFGKITLKQAQDMIRHWQDYVQPKTFGGTVIDPDDN